MNGRPAAVPVSRSEPRREARARSGVWPPSRTAVAIETRLATAMRHQALRAAVGGLSATAVRTLCPLRPTSLVALGGRRSGLAQAAEVGVERKFVTVRELQPPAAGDDLPEETPRERECEAERL